MESLVASARISCSPSPFAPLSIFSPKRTTFSIRPPSLQISSKNGEDVPDLHSDAEDTALVPFSQNYFSLSRLPKVYQCMMNPIPFSLDPIYSFLWSQDEAMGLVLSAAVGKGWTTGSGMEGPIYPDSDSGSRPISTFPWSLFTKSPRRRMRVAFTCNICGQRTTRAINPHAYTDGTVFVQCCGCNVFHKLVDNLNLFHEMKCYVNPTFRYKGDARFTFLDGDDDDANIFPSL